jgi:hypothetical protein
MSEPCKGDFNEVRKLAGGGWGQADYVFALRELGRGKGSEVYDTKKTIDQWIKNRKLFVCDESNVSTVRTESSYNPSKPEYMGLGHGGGKRKKSRKPKRRNSRSNRRKTLNKSKK